MSAPTTSFSIFLFENLTRGEQMLTYFHSMCFIFCPQLLKIKGGILFVCEVCSNKRDGRIGSLLSFLFGISAVTLTMS